MSAVEIRLNPSDLSREMGAMRGWLDQHHFEASGFSCRHEEGGVLVCLEFTRASEARAFANRFAFGTGVRSTTDASREFAGGTLVTGLSPSGLIG
jgi:hypothetical protein